MGVGRIVKPRPRPTVAFAMLEREGIKTVPLRRARRQMWEGKEKKESITVNTWGETDTVRERLHIIQKRLIRIP